MPKSTITNFSCAKSFPDGTIELREYGQFNTVMHYHEQVQILSPTNGTLFIYTEGNSVCVPNGFYVQIPAMTPHKLLSRSPRLLLKTIFLDMEPIQDKLSVYPPQELLDHFLRFGEKHWNLDTAESMTQTSIQAFKSMVPLLLTKSFQAEVVAAQSDVMIAVSTYILDNLHNKISIAEIAEAFNMSQRSLFRQFKDELQLTIFQFIKQHRLLRALHLLENKDLQISQIVYQIGYDSTSNFSNLFKEHFGLSPQQYRANLSH
ncbi:AraC family transcriptional regulator [Sphingobacterium sp. InxBP1]|uniref:helix-turn-helix domain-containing protein n=1 Tax=Sphingobacterium sp. InxBP1 TaxID=2870328 RepID=UPI002243A4F6|nr:AraC family transcriptional regulator [Sphingobacterium sp. InxBP1]MCW8313299.1 AraC family transcriptional regulator [Sphingobacterium sp. InxBP1]